MNARDERSNATAKSRAKDAGICPLNVRLPLFFLVRQSQFVGLTLGVTRPICTELLQQQFQGYGVS